MRNTTAILGLILLGLLLVMQGMPLVAQDEKSSKTSTEVLSLQQERIELLEERIAYIESLMDIDKSIGSSALIRPRMDLLHARVDYAETTADKVDFLTQLMSEYDKLIDMAENVLHEPPRVGESQLNRLAGSDVLWLKAERVRVQISRDVLRQDLAK